MVNVMLLIIPMTVTTLSVQTAKLSGVVDAILFRIIQDRHVLNVYLKIPRTQMFNIYRH